MHNVVYLVENFDETSKYRYLEQIEVDGCLYWKSLIISLGKVI